MVSLNLLLKFFFLFWFFTVSLFQYSCAQQTQDAKVIVLDLVLEKLYSDHFERKPIDDDFSKKFFQNYLENIDPLKLYLTQEDVDYLKKYETAIDDELRFHNFSFFNDVDKIISKRMLQSKSIYENVIANRFDFKKEETYVPEPPLFPKNETELSDRWRKYVKLMILKDIALSENVNKKSTFEANYKKAVEKVKTNMEDRFFALSKANNTEQRFEIYVNTIAQLFDPHTQYLFPSDLDNFNTHISGEFEGIGATLQQTHEGLKVISVITGGPAWKQGNLKEGDTILFVKSDSTKEPIDISVMDINKAISYIKGPKGTDVTLTVKHLGGAIQDVTITRNVVKLEDTYARAAVIEETGKKIGYLKLPTFYVKTGENTGRNSSEDVENILKELNRKNIDGLIFDLRDNGGGSLSEVSKMIGLFIKKGPVVQVKYKNYPTHVETDDDSRITYTKPMIVLTNEFSASASEIFAAAIQDYRRGVIVGSEQTYGKGTVQVVYPMEPFARKIYNYKKPIGAFKITIQKFYRINGDATQLKGVSSDIVLPDVYARIKSGEANQKYPIKWDEISKTDYTPMDLSANLEDLRKRSARRIANDPFFQMVRETSEKLAQMQNDKNINLNYEQFKKDYSKGDIDKIALKKEKALLKMTPLENSKEEAENVQREKFIKDSETDPYIKEASNILNDWIS